MTSYALNEEKMFVDITDGIAIVINSETGIYYGMNTLGTSVFENIIKGISVENILNNLNKLPNAADTETKLNNFISELKNKEIIVEGNDSGEISNIGAEAASEGFELEVNEYNDAQELLLADPIHEVKEDTGWTPEKDSIGYTKEEVIKMTKGFPQIYGLSIENIKVP